MKDIEKRKLQDFEDQIRNERPEDEQNPTLIRELAMIRYNYHLTTFKEVFNDVIEERRHIIKEEFMSGGSQMIGISLTLDSMTANANATAMPQTGALLRSNQSQSTLKSRVQNAMGSRDRSGGPQVSKKGTISTSASVMALPSTNKGSVLLTENDQKQIDKIRVRQERFTSKLIVEQNKKEKYQQQLIARSQKHE